MNIAIIGSGSWGVALAVHLANVGNNVKIWSFMEEERDLINNERKCKFLPGVELPENIMCSTDFGEVIKDSKMILHVTPSKFTRDTVKQYKQYLLLQFHQEYCFLDHILLMDQPLILLDLR